GNASDDKRSMALSMFCLCLFAWLMINAHGQLGDADMVEYNSGILKKWNEKVTAAESRADNFLTFWENQWRSQSDSQSDSRSELVARLRANVIPAHREAYDLVQNCRPVSPRIERLVANLRAISARHLRYYVDLGTAIESEGDAAIQRLHQNYVE